MKSLDQEFDELYKKSEIEFIFFDDCTDATKVMLKTKKSDQQFPSTIKELYSLCSEPGGSYVYHFTPEKSSKTGRPAQVIADNLVYFMKKKGIDKSLKAIGGDSTTGCEGGAMHWVEVEIDCKLNWLVCAFHMNELPL
uniref:Uncharacterized protein n=1 Tax=Micrurus paraensis TaxID=1970185 RepID=A0A2D4JZW6_9SAUR